MTSLASSTITSLPHLQMNSSQSQPNGKRKAIEDSNPLLAAKRAKKETKGTSTKRKLLNAEETPGGLLIIRAPEAHISSSQPAPSNRPSSRQASLQPQTFSNSTAGAGPSRPPAKKFRAQSQPAARDIIQDDVDIEKDVRAMEDEADHLRRNSRAHTTIDSSLSSTNPAFQFPSRPDPNRTKKGKERTMDISVPIAEDETPQIERNKLLRQGAVAAIVNGRSRERGQSRQETTPTHRRKSSLSRGKRISTSFETTGIITQPHNSVSDASFFKHIDCDLPDSERLRQLLIWCSLRAASFPSRNTFTSTSQNPPSHAPLPPLSSGAANLLKVLQGDVIRMLAEKRIDLSLHDPGASERGPGKNLKENEQNVRNRAWEVTYSEQIQKLQEEDEAWKQMSYFYETYAKKVQASSAKRAAFYDALSSPSAKAKGKRRATGDSADFDGLPEEHELPKDLQRGLSLAKSVLGLHAPGEDRMVWVGNSSMSHTELDAELNRLLPDLEFKLDHLRTCANTARAATAVAENMLNQRFDILVGYMNRRNNAQPPYTTDSEGGSGLQLLSNYVERDRGEGGSLALNPLTLMRALSRVDKERPPASVGDAARQAAREVQRIGESGVGVVGERRLTVPVPSTPRKTPGTPRRGGTPGRDRER